MCPKNSQQLKKKIKSPFNKGVFLHGNGTDLALKTKDDKVEEVNKQNVTREHERVRVLLRKEGQTEDELERDVDKIYKLADALFDIWLESKNNK